MRTDNGLPQTNLLIARTRKFFGKIPGGARCKLQIERLAFPADCTMGLGSERRQPLDQRRTHGKQLRSIRNERRIVSGNFAQSRMGRFQERVARTKCTLVRTKRRPITRVDLGSEKIEVPAPRLRAATSQFDVACGERNNMTDAQIIRRLALLDTIERELAPQRAIAEFEKVFIVMAAYGKRFLVQPNEWRERRIALRLQPQKNTRRFQN
jgi:hypothetical protein